MDDGNQFLTGRPLLRAVDPADLKTAWVVQQEVQQEMQELAKKYPPCPPSTAHQFDQNQIPRIRDLVKFGPAVQHRMTMLAGLRAQNAALGSLGLNCRDCRMKNRATLFSGPSLLCP